MPDEKPISKEQKLLMLCARGDLDEVKALLDDGVSVACTDHFKQTPLQMAAMNCRVEVCKLLLERGAPVGALDKWGRTPLDIAKQFANHSGGMTSDGKELPPSEYAEKPKDGPREDVYQMLVKAAEMS